MENPTTKIKEISPPHNLGRNRVNTYAVRITMLIADIEDDIMDPVMQCTTLPSHSGFSLKKLVSFVTEIHTTSIDFLLLVSSSNSTAVGLDDGVVASFQRSWIHKPNAHTQAFKVNRSTLYHQRASKSIKESYFGKIVRLIIIYVKQECNKYEHVGQEYKMIKEVKSR
ncbi:hypothetical protein Tco_1105401 [Tanacetum coccineum]